MKVINPYDDIYLDNIPKIIIKTKKDLSQNKNIKVINKFEHKTDNYTEESYKKMVGEIVDDSYSYSLFDDTGKIKFDDEYAIFKNTLNKRKIKTLIKSLFGNDLTNTKNVYVSFNNTIYRISNKNYEIYFVKEY